MSAIRPDLPANMAPLAPAAPLATARAAQAAFFRAALDQAAAPAPIPGRAQPAPADEGEPRLPRPGALLDIRV